MIFHNNETTRIASIVLFDKHDVDRLFEFNLYLESSDGFDPEIMASPDGAAMMENLPLLLSTTRHIEKSLGYNSKFPLRISMPSEWMENYLRFATCTILRNHTDELIYNYLVSAFYTPQVADTFTEGEFLRAFFDPLWGKASIADILQQHD